MTMAKKIRYKPDQLDEDILKIINEPVMEPDLLGSFRQAIGAPQGGKAPGVRPLVPTFPKLPKV